MLTGFFVKKREPGFVVCAGDPMEKPQQIRGAESGCWFGQNSALPGEAEICHFPLPYLGYSHAWEYAAF